MPLALPRPCRLLPQTPLRDSLHPEGFIKHSLKATGHVTCKDTVTSDVLTPPCHVPTSAKQNKTKMAIKLP